MSYKSSLYNLQFHVLYKVFHGEINSIPLDQPTWQQDTFIFTLTIEAVNIAPFPSINYKSLYHKFSFHVRNKTCCYTVKNELQLNSVNQL